MNYEPFPIPTEGLDISLILNFIKTRYITHIEMKEFITSLYSFDYEAKETRPSSSDEKEEINLFAQESFQRDSEKVKPKKKKKSSLLNKLSEPESDSEVHKEKGNLIEK